MWWRNADTHLDECVGSAARQGGARVKDDETEDRDRLDWRIVRLFLPSPGFICLCVGFSFAEGPFGPSTC